MAKASCSIKAFGNFTRPVILASMMGIEIYNRINPWEDEGCPVV